MHENLLNVSSRTVLHLSKCVQEVWSLYPCPPFCPPYAVSPVKRDSLIAIGASWTTIMTIAYEPKLMASGYDLDVAVIGTTT